MAQLQSTTIATMLQIGTTSNTSAAGYLWYDTTAKKFQYSNNVGSAIDL